MSISLTPEQVESAFALSADERYEFFLDLVAENNTVYTLKDDQGCLLVTSEEESCLPVWPDEALAKACAEAEWNDFEPLAISLSDWLEKWVPGMTNDGHLVAVFPNQNTESVIVPPTELAEDMAVS